MDSAVQTEEASSRPHISASKQTRILIWRSEVASAIESSSPLSPLSSSRSSSTTTTTGSASQAFSFPSPAPAQPISRRQRFWRRLSRGFSGGFSLERQLGQADHEESERTGMYAARAAGFVDVDAGGMEEGPLGEEGDVVPGERSSAGGGLKEKQERLKRAARLLDQGARQP